MKNVYNMAMQLKSMKKHIENNWIYGIHPVMEFLRAGGGIRSIYISKGTHNKRMQEIISRAKTENISVKMVNKDFFIRFKNDVHHLLLHLQQPLK